MRERPERLGRLPEQYFARLVARAVAAAADGGPPVVDLGRASPETGPAPIVAETLAAAAARGDAHGYAPFRGLPALRAAVAARYRDVYGVELDPDREVAIVPGTKTAIFELAEVLTHPGDTVLLPDPFYPDYPSGIRYAGARVELVHLDPSAGWQPDLAAAPPAAALYLNYPSNPCAVCAAPGTFEAAVDWAHRTGGAVVHDAAYIDLVYDGRRPRSFLATPGGKDVGVELFSMSKSFGMAGWRIGFVVGNAEIVERINLLSDHSRIGMLAPLQHAAVAALTDTAANVEERRAAYERRSHRVAEVLPGVQPAEGAIFTWLHLPDGLDADGLLAEHRVIVAPGEGFGPGGKGWGRLSLAVTDEQLEAGLERLVPALAGAPSSGSSPTKAAPVKAVHA